LEVHETSTNQMSRLAYTMKESHVIRLKKVKIYH